MLLDQQIPMEKAFRGPAVLLERLGHLDAAQIAEADAEGFAALMAKPPAVHRFPGSMAKRVQELCRALVEHHGGRAEAVWEGVDGRRRRCCAGCGRCRASVRRRRRSSWHCSASSTA
jgi:uncharacterized HhH-GPD family protein